MKAKRTDAELQPCIVMNWDHGCGEGAGQCCDYARCKALVKAHPLRPDRVNRTKAKGKEVRR